MKQGLTIWLLLVACAAAQTASYGHHGMALLPSAAHTPGAVRTTDAKAVCSLPSTKDVRHVTPAQKRQVYALYGVSPRPGVCCEVDHLISLELGGSNDTANLWPEPYSPRPGAHEKDVLENWLHRQVCSGRMPLAQAQQQIAGDWYAAYLQMKGTQ